jgi:hypothetical protein
MCPLEVRDPATPGHHGEGRRQHAEDLEGLPTIFLVDATEGPGDQGDEGVNDGVDLILSHLQAIGFGILHLVRGIEEI